MIKEPWLEPHSEEYLFGWNGKNQSVVEDYLKSLLAVADPIEEVGCCVIRQCMHCKGLYNSSIASCHCVRASVKRIMNWFKRQPKSWQDNFAAEVFNYATSIKVKDTETAYRYAFEALPSKIRGRMNPPQGELVRTR